MFLEFFKLPTQDDEELIIETRAYEKAGKYGYVDNSYPCNIYPRIEFENIQFSPITIFYGGNGSGKSTLLNIIAQKLELKRISPFNSSETFELYLEKCAFEMGKDEEEFTYRVPNNSRIITSDDIFDYMLTARTGNETLQAQEEFILNNWSDLLDSASGFNFKSMEDLEMLKLYDLARRKSVSRRKFIQRIVGKEVNLQSNGETAIEYFYQKIKNDAIYCLDEPENSLSPKNQLYLAELIKEWNYTKNCQFIIATHSPFLLAIDNARIYNLDADPVKQESWYNLQNPRVYFEFFDKYKELFL